MSSLEGDGRWEECSRERKKVTRAFLFLSEKSGKYFTLYIDSTFHSTKKGKQSYSP